jgi:F-type H+-transporting ATPase subunit c
MLDLIAQTATAAPNFGPGFALGIVGIGVAIGLGLIGQAAMSGMARQPEAIGKIQTPMLIALAFVELVFLLTVFVGLGSTK